MRRLAVLIFVLCFLFPQHGGAECSWSDNTGTPAATGDPATYTAASMSECISDAAGKTGVVVIQIPDSTTTWTDYLTINMQSGWTNVTGLTIRGQNDCTMTANASPSFDYPTACGTNIAALDIRYTGKEGKAFRVAHMRLTGSGSPAMVYLDGDSKSWRLDHLFFDHATTSLGRQVWIRKSNPSFVTAGVIDHNYFHQSSTIIHYQPDDGGNADWMGSLGLGTSDAFYIEANKMDWDTGNYYMTDSNGPGKFVFRYNHVTNGCTMAHDAIVGNYRGVRKWEIYGNTYYYNGTTNDNYVHDGRAGTGVFFNNTITEASPGHGVSVGGYIKFSVYRTYQTGGNPWDVLCSNSSGKALLNTTANYPQTCTDGDGCINIDGSSDGSGDTPNGYPCRDQLGFEGNNPQTSRPFLLWNNTINGGPIVVGAAQPDYIKANRDFCLSATTIPTSGGGCTNAYSYAPFPYPYPTDANGFADPTGGGTTQYTLTVVKGMTGKGFTGKY